MKAKTKLQHEVIKLSKKLKPVTNAQIKWAYDNCFPKLAHRTKHQINCLECGFSWNDEFVLGSLIAGDTCPKCGTKLKVKSTRKRGFGGFEYFSIFQIVEGFQVIRTVWAHKDVRVGRKANYCAEEVTQHWINEKGKCVFLALESYSIFWNSGWKFGKGMQLKQNYSRNWKLPIKKVAPGRQILPNIRRNGFTGSFHDIAPQYLFMDLLSNPKAETLWKAGQLSLFKEIGGYENRVNKYWSSIKICLRNNYIVKDAGIWFDYLENLVEFRKDIHSAKFVCPAELNAEHDRYVRKMQAVRERRHREELMRDMVIYEPIYAKEKGRFFGLLFTDGNITIKTIESVREVKLEGDTIGHCVFTNDYHKKKNTLLMSAQVNGVRTETIEVYLNPLQISQCRGKNNQRSKYHDRILQLLEANLHQIKKRMRVHSKKSIEQLETVAA